MADEPIEQRFQEDVEGLIKKYYDTGLTLSSTIGVFEICKSNLIMEYQEEDDDDNLIPGVDT